MSSVHDFKRIRRRGQKTIARPSRKALISLLSRHVARRFTRAAGADLIVVPINLKDGGQGEDLPSTPCHPTCVEFADSDYCRESWQLHLAELQRCPATHWHKCDFERFCALVPVVWRNQCVAVLKLACPLTMPSESFEQKVELLDLLVQQFVVSQVEFLERLLIDEQAAGSPDQAPTSSELPTLKAPSDPRIAEALQLIEERLADPKLCVAAAASVLGMHPNYLSHLFVAQVGQRMSRFIAARRVEKAMHLLVTTNWQIKRVATETGHANSNWFCHVFAALTGLAPGAYRKRSRSGA